MSKRSGCKILAAVAALGLSVLSASKAQAGYTSINAPFPGEASQAQILSNSFGGTFTSSGLNLTNGSVTAKRINDSTDQTFHGGITSATTLGTFAQYSQGLAYSSGGSTKQLFTVSGKGFSATGSTGAVDLPASYSFVRTGGTKGIKGTNESSKNSANADGKDHLITYLLSGKGVTGPTYVLFWEDKTKQQHSDFDFNDLAVEVKSTSPIIVPLPAAAWSGLVTLAGAALVTGYRKARRTMA
jgi:hypothetical protein